MPYLTIRSNQHFDDEQSETLLKQASKLLASELSKPESYIMVALEPPRAMMFAGDKTPTAYLELKSIGLSENITAQLSQALCGLMKESVGIEKDRIYIEFADAPRKMWGWNGGTF